MKRHLIGILLVLVLLLSLSACTAANAVQTLDIVEDKVEAKLDAAEEKVEESLRNVVATAPAPAATEPAAAPAAEPTIPAAPVEKLPDAALTREQAEQIALEYLGFAPDQVNRLRSEFDWDDGVPQYDVEFRKGREEYEFEIHAESGKILSWDKDFDD